MKEETMLEALRILTNCYIELNKIHAEPGNKCHMLAYSIKFIERAMKPIVCPQVKITTSDFKVIS